MMMVTRPMCGRYLQQGAGRAAARGGGRQSGWGTKYHRAWVLDVLSRQTEPACSHSSPARHATTPSAPPCGCYSPNHLSHDVPPVEPQLALGVQAAVIAPVVITLRGRRGHRARASSRVVHVGPREEAAGSSFLQRWLTCHQLQLQVHRIQQQHSPYRKQHSIKTHRPAGRTFVSISRLLLLSARWCTLTIRCTMGISRPSVLNTTASSQV